MRVRKNTHYTIFDIFNCPVFATENCHSTTKVLHHFERKVAVSGVEASRYGRSGGGGGNGGFKQQPIAKLLANINCAWSEWP